MRDNNRIKHNDDNDIIDTDNTNNIENDTNNTIRLIENTNHATRRNSTQAKTGDDIKPGQTSYHTDHRSAQRISSWKIGDIFIITFISRVIINGIIFTALVVWRRYRSKMIW